MSNAIQPAARPKRGRKPKPYVTSWGETIDGLRRRSHDGRWVLTDGSGRMFRETDERRAVQRARELLGDALAGFVRHWSERQLAMSMPQLWRYVAEQIRVRPQWVAEQTGIEEIGYLTDIRKPEKPPTLAELGEIWKAHARCSPDQRRKVLRAWEDFIANARVAGLGDITASVCIEYRDSVWDRLVTRRGDDTPTPISPKQQSHLFQSIRTLLRFAQKRGVATTKIANALAAMQSLEPSETTDEANPKPIKRAEFVAMLSKAEGADRAMLLLMLNGGFYLSEVIRLEWAEIDLERGVIITRRRKRGRMIRVCTLWPETIAALADVPRKGERLFYNYAGEPIAISGAQLRFTKIATAAGVDVTASQFRDGAATAMGDADVSPRLQDVVMGHKSGISDRYVFRNPRQVAEACEAIRAAYIA